MLWSLSGYGTVGNLENKVGKSGYAPVVSLHEKARSQRAFSLLPDFVISLNVVGMSTMNIVMPKALMLGASMPTNFSTNTERFLKTHSGA